ncbi:lysozyme inhibitor LprI family protein [Clostridium sp.]|uniref:lysozyme inhibitor LprI family protein n=1 Tax=Clostridium sp. TaxID=1506 RepID=UPI002629E2C2|nr:lysozyme inhibitor LprI family protein [Clostridium sp.]
MRKIVICLLFAVTLLTGCVSKKDSSLGDLKNKSNKETIESSKNTNEQDDTTSNNKIIDEVKDYILNGQQDKPEALKLKWSKTFLNETDIESLYNDFLESSGKKDDVQEFAKYITENAPILKNWEELFKKDVYETYKEKIVNIKRVEDGLYEGSVIINGTETPYVIVSARTGYYHGTSGTIQSTDNNANTSLTKQSYLNQLDKLKSDLESSKDTRYASPVTLDLIEAANDEYKLWDDKLNEIYSVLKQELPKDKMDKLTEEELNWINVRDEKSKAASKLNEGGSIAPLNEVTSLIKSTRDRCYELVNKYIIEKE